jgi:hypothetical protein
LLDTELDQEWKPQKDKLTTLAGITPWSCALSSFFLIGSLTFILESIWPTSPFFFVVRLVGKILIAILQLLSGIVQLVFSGHASLIRNITTVFASEVARRGLPPLIVGLISALILRHVLARSHIPLVLLPYINAACLILPISLVAIPEVEICTAWIFDLGRMVTLACTG